MCVVKTGEHTNLWLEKSWFQPNILQPHPCEFDVDQIKGNLSVICSWKCQFNFFTSKVRNAYAPTFCPAKAHIFLENNKTNVHLLKHKWVSTALKK